jgi:protocatechuate 3,4-dioxygenase beta subunit
MRNSSDSNASTIFPGWYSGRTVHIHIMVRTYSSSGNQTLAFATQLFFDDTVTNTVMALSPYNSRGTRGRTNRTDSLYSSDTQVTLIGSTSAGYATTFTIGVQTS